MIFTNPHSAPAQLFNIPSVTFYKEGKLLLLTYIFCRLSLESFIAVA